MMAPPLEAYGLRAALNLVAAVPLVVAAVLLQRRSKAAPLCAAAVFVAIDLCLVTLPRAAPLASLRWNWQGQLLRTALALVWIYGLGLPKAADAGLRRTVPAAAARDALVVSVALFVLGLTSALMAPSERPSAETILYEATLPGIAEELAYRGVVQGLLNRAFEPTRTVAGARVGWGLLITAAVFLSMHVIHVDARAHVTVSHDAGTWLGVAITALGLGYLRERTGSLWPGMLVHNAVNTVQVL